MNENEVVFRKYNESIKKGFDELTRIAKEDGMETLFQPPDSPLYFYCECSDENCRERVQLKPSSYDAIHKHRARFVIVPGHETESIERIFDKKTGYDVVEKLVTPSESVTTLKKTEVDNS